MFIRLLLALFGTVVAATSADANFLVELTFSEKMARSDVVIVGTVTAATPGLPGEFDATATVAVLATLKGRPQAQHIVFTKPRIAEEATQCCDVGSTYVMFLGQKADGSGLLTVNGRFGMVRIGPSAREPKVEVVKEPGANNR